MAQREDILELATELVAAYVSHNQLEKEALPDLVRTVYLSMLGTLDMEPVIVKEKPKPAVDIKTSVQGDLISCLECGLAYKSLKRHLRTAHDTTPTAYREKFDLPADYPMVAPEYSKQRSKLAKRTGLGKS